MDKELLEIQKRAIRYAKKREGMLETHQEPEDFAAYCVEKKLKNRYSRLKWMFIDYLREGSGSKGSNGYSEKSALKRATSLNAVIGDSNTERIELLDVGCGGSDFEARKELEYIKRLIRNEDKRLIQIFEWLHEEKIHKEIGVLLGVTESRVSQIVKVLFEKIKDKKKKSEEYKSMSQLSNAESQVYDLIIKGMSNQQIADKLYVSEKTAKYHCTNIFKKVGVSTRQELIAKHFGEEIDMKEINNLPMNQDQQNYMQKEQHKESINFIHDKFGVGQTVDQLQHMMKEVTKDGITPNSVNAACNCVARLNETIDTAIKAARFLKNG
jgi:DNA-binding CsgD family transcriptional regulator